MASFMPRSTIQISQEKLQDAMQGNAITLEVQSEYEEKADDGFAKEEIIKNMSYACEGDDSGDDDSDCLPFERMARKMENVSVDGGVKKILLKAGAGKVVPEDSIVRVHYNAYLEMASEPYDSTRLREHAHKFRLGSKEVLTGFDMAVATMCKGEFSRFMIQPEYALGESGCPPRVPSNATVMMEIELLSFVEEGGVEDFFHLTNEERGKLTFDDIKKVCNAQREEGNVFVNEKKWHRAMPKYRKATDILEQVNLKNATEQRDQQKILLKLYLNMALCCLKQQNYPHVITLCGKVLEMECHNVKAMFRKAMAFRKLGDFDRAKEWLIKARKEEPNNGDIAKELALLEKNVKDFVSMEKSMCKKMFRKTKKKGTESETSEKETETESEETNILTEISDDFTKMVNSKLIAFQSDENDDADLPFPACNLTVPEIGYIMQAATDLGLNVVQIGEGYNLRLKVCRKPKPKEGTEE